MNCARRTGTSGGYAVSGVRATLSPMLSHLPALVLLAAQVLTAMLLGAAIGLERELTAQPAGLRTHMLVSLGAAVFTIAGAHAVPNNPAAIAAPVVTGVGFLGGG